MTKTLSNEEELSSLIKTLKIEFGFFSNFDEMVKLDSMTKEKVIKFFRIINDICIHWMNDAK